MVASEELRELQMQVQKLRERLDFMAPMLSLLNFTQDYFQRVECEASVQLMRLRNARLAEPAAPEGSEEPTAPHAVETAKLLHTMTDLMIGLFGSGAAAAHAPSGKAEAEARKEAPTSQTPRPEDGAPTRPGTSGRGAFLLGPKASRSPGASASTASSGSWASSAGPRARAEVPPPARGGQETSERPRANLDGPRPQRGPAAGRAEAPRGPQASWGRPHALESTLEVGGLALGRGTWANAYRQATGARRDALRLLCSLGIVTERELADDLTVISEEHIDECVDIAAEMLRKWAPELGPPPLQEAKAFFEQRLAALYLQRAPAPFGFN